MGDGGSIDSRNDRECRQQAEKDQKYANRFSRYVLGDEIARGAMGAIHRGHDRQLDRELAIKVLLSEHHHDQEASSRFVEEAKITGQLQHPGIVPVYEVGATDDERPFFSMKLVDGQTLSKLLSERKEIGEDLGHFLKIFNQICQAMAYAHKHRVLHRDLKPANIMVGAFGEVQVMDWGIAKVLEAQLPAVSPNLDGEGPVRTQTVCLQDLEQAAASGNSSLTIHGTLLGTPAYIAPEQARGEIDRLDERADVFSLGAILCEILTGNPPYTGLGNQVIRKAWNADLQECYQRLDACTADDTIVALAKKCLSPDLADRPTNAGQVADWVDRYEAQVQSRLRDAELAKADALARRDEALRRRRLYRMIAILLGLHAVGVTVTATIYRTQRQEQVKLNEDLRGQQISLEKQQIKLETAMLSAQAASDHRAQLLYAADMQLAPILWEREETPTASLQQLLDGHMPKDNQPDLRGFEWHYFQGQLEGDTISWEIPGRDLAINEKGELVLIGEDHTIHFLDPVSDEPRATVQLPESMNTSNYTLSPRGEWLASFQGNELSVYECATGRLKNIGLEFEPSALRFTDKGSLLFLGPQKQVGARNTRTLVQLATTDWSQQQIPMKQDFAWAESPVLGTADSRLVGIVNPRQPNLSRVALALANVDVDGEATANVQALVIPFGGASIGAWALDQVQQRAVVGRLSSGEVSMIDLRDQDNQKVTLEHASVLSSASFNPDGKLLATGTSNGLIKLWEVGERDGKLDVSFLRTFKGHLSAILFLQFHPDGQRLISSDGHVTKVWELQQETSSMEAFQGVSGSSLDLAFSADGKWYALADAIQDHLKIQSVETGEVRWSQALVNPPIVSVAFSPDGRYVAFGHRESQVTVWDEISGERVLDWDGENDRLDVISLDFSDDGNQLAVGLGFTAGHNNAIRHLPLILDVHSGKTVFTLTEHENACSRIAFSHDGKQVLTSSHFGMLTRWDLITGRAEQIFDAPENLSLPWGNSISDFSIAPDGKTIAVSCEGGTIYLIDSQSSSVRQLEGHSAAVTAVAYSPDGKTLASAGADGTVRLWHVATDREMVNFTTGLHHLFVCFSPDSKRLVAGGMDELGSGSTVRVWAINEKIQ
ncbi:MAG: protein kinase [Planctomycetales bacterium]|nr:protein kinase [Planctomycetales bacterium]